LGDLLALLHVYLKLKSTAESNYRDIVRSTKLIGGKTSEPNKLRIYFINGSFLDVWLTQEGDYSYHWESTLQNGMIHRWDNAPDHPQIPSFPKHFHDGSNKNVKESSLSENPEHALIEILDFIKTRLKKE
jgi:hypothetical protein